MELRSLKTVGGYSNAGVYDQSVLDAIDYFNVYGGGEAMNGGITLFSAGNSNSPPGQWYPACYSGCFSVAATNNQDKRLGIPIMIHG